MEAHRIYGVPSFLGGGLNMIILDPKLVGFAYLQKAA